MAIGIVSDLDFESELNKLNSHSKSVPEVEIRDKTPLGRGEDNVGVPDSLRKIIGETSEINGRKEALELAERFDISPSSVSAYSNGSTSCKTYNNPQTDLKNHILSAKERISQKARRKLSLALGHITDEKLGSARVDIISSVARNMAAIVKDMEPSPIDPGQKSNLPPFVIFAPSFKKESHFDIIEYADTIELNS